MLTLVGRKILQLLKNLTASEKPGEKNFNDLKDVLIAHYKPKVNLTTERYRFQSRKQGQGESIPDYLAALKQLSLKCEFGNQLNNRLCDAFVFGLANTETKKRLLQKDKLELDKAVAAASAIEQANADAVELSREAKNVNAVSRDQSCKRRPRRQRPSKKQPQADSKACSRCGRNNHDSDACCFKDRSCDHCGIKGPIPPA